VCADRTLGETGPVGRRDGGGPLEERGEIVHAPTLLAHARGYPMVMAMTAKTVVQKYLMGDFPTTRDDLLVRAERQGADHVVLGLVRRLRNERFESAVAVEHALEDAHRRA
jgi:hypothetical protein